MKAIVHRTIHVAILAILILAVASAQGLHWKSTTTAMGKEMFMEQFLMPKMIKTVTNEGEALVVRLDKKMIYEIKPEAKEYSEMTFEEFDQFRQKMLAKSKAMQEQMQEQMKNMPEAQRKMMEQMMGGQGAATTKKTDEQKKIAGYNCTKHVISQGDKEVMTVWITSDVKEFSGLKKDYEEFAKRFSADAPGLTGAFNELMKLQGFPMETEMGTMMTQTVTLMEKRSTPASEYNVPAGYTKVKSKWQQQLEGGQEKE